MDDRPGSPPDGHWVASVEAPRGTDPEHVAARLWQAGAVGVQVHPRRVDGWFDRPPEEVAATVEATVGAAVQDPANVGVAWRFEPTRDHLAAWREATDAIAAGPFDVVPTHRIEDHPPRPGRHRIVLDPGQAFGSGHHATTTGCLVALADDSAEPPVAGARVLDVGTGTGILALGAVLLGASEVLGVDTDEHAVEVARRNVADNLAAEHDASPEVVRLEVGSLDVVDGDFDVVVANLLTHTVVALAEGLFAVTRPGGRLVASGIGTPRADVAVTALRAAGFTAVEVREHDEWVVVTARRPSAADPVDGASS